MRILIITSIVFLCSCTQKEEKLANNLSPMDSALNYYIQYHDSYKFNTPYDVFTVLKLYYKNDTLLLDYIEQFKNKHEFYLERTKRHDSIAKLYSNSPFHEIDDVEAYRFELLRSRIPYSVFITISKQNDSIYSLHTSKIIVDTTGKEYFTYLAEEVFQEINEMKNIDKTEWDSFNKIIRSSHFWSLQSWDDEICGSECVGCSSWDLWGLRTCNSIKEYHFVHRLSPQKGSFKELGEYLIELSNNDFDPYDKGIN